VSTSERGFLAILTSLWRLFTFSRWQR